MAWSGWSTLQESKWGAGNSPDIYFQWQYRYDRSGADMIYQIWCRVRKPSGTYGYNIYFNCYMDNAWKCGGYLKNSSTSSWSYYPSESGYYSDAFTISNKTSGTTALKFNVYSPNAGTSRSTDFTQSMTVTAAGSDISISPRGTSYILGNSSAGANIALTRYSSSFADILTYTANGSSSIDLTSITSGGSTTYEWSTIPLSLAQYNTTGTTIPIIVTITTKTSSSGSVIQSKTASFNATIPNTSGTRPTVTLNISDPSDFVNTFGGYIQGVTSVEVVATGTRKYGAEITPNITIDGTSYVPAVEYDGDSVECARQTKITTNTGTRTITAVFTDSRGFTASTSSNITVLPYSNPTITYVEAQRCTGASDPTPKGDGAYALLKFKGNITTFNQSGYTENEIGYALSYQIDEGTEQTVTNFSTDSSGNQYVIVSLPLTSVMDIAFKVGDSINTVSYTPTVSVAHVPVAIKFLHGNAAKTGLGVGMLSTKPTGGLEIGMDTFYYGDVQHDTAGVGVFGQIMNEPPSGVTPIPASELIDLVYPVGSIYMSTNSTSPVTLFGGQWIQIQDTFLLSAGSTYIAGTTGGEAAHILTINEMPTHYHEVTPSYGTTSSILASNSNNHGKILGAIAGAGWSSNSVSDEGSKPVNYTGGNQSHNNLPPYLVVYMWRRTA